MVQDELSYNVCNELKILNSEVTKKRFNDFASKFKEVAEHIKSGEITQDEYIRAESEFVSIISCDDSLSKLTSFGMFMLLLIGNDFKSSSIRKTKGAYSVPDKVIDGVIKNIIYGEKVLDACSFAGISTVTLYNRIRDRGYDNIREFFREQKRNIKEEK